MLQRQLKARLEEGQGEAIYEIGMGGRWSLYTRWVLGEVGGLCTPGGYWGSLNFSKRKQVLCTGIVGPEEVLYCNILEANTYMIVLAFVLPSYLSFPSHLLIFLLPLPPPPLSSTVGCSTNGLQPDEMEASLATVASLASACNADFQVLRKKPMEAGMMAQVLLRRKVNEDDFLEVRCVLTKSGRWRWTICLC